MTTETKVKHTPTPSCLAKECKECWPVVEWAEEDQILLINEKAYSKSEVVRAVNAHDELVTWLRHARTALNLVTKTAGKDDATLSYSGLIGDIDDVLAKAEGK